MYVCSKISFAPGLRLLFVATVFVFVNFGFSAISLQGQIPELGATQGPPQEALREYLPLPDFFVTNENAPADPQTPAKHSAPVVRQKTSVANWNAPINQTATDFVSPPSAPTVNPTKYGVANWNAPTNQAVTDFVTPTIAPTVNPTEYGVANQNVVQYANPPTNRITHTRQLVPGGNPYFDAPTIEAPTIEAPVIEAAAPITAAPVFQGPIIEAPVFQEQTVNDQVSLVLPPVPQILTQPINRTGGGSGLLSAYQSRSILQAGEEFHSTQSSGLPHGFQPWWSQENQSALGLKASPLQVSLDGLIQRALTNSPHIQVAATQPHIQQAALLEESSRFDWMSFLESTYDDQNDPVGNTLTTGNNDSRFQQQEWYAEGGVRRQTRTGGEFELSQRISTLQSNSQFLSPPDQGNSRLVLNYRQPLLRGRGRAVNESLIVLADINLQTASDELLNEIQQHLTDLTETYWELVRARSELLQRRRLLIEAEKILTQLEGRAEVDALERQVFRARSAVAKRKAEIARSVTSVKNAESRIRLLVNDQQIISAASMELVPVDMPNLEFLGISLGDAISTALSNRPDISRSIREIKATSVQLGISRNDLLPKLDLLVGSYVAGLDADFDILGATGNQFSEGRPGFNLGFEFEAPIGNRAAQARQSRRTWEANRAMHQFRAVVESGLTEVELAVREVQTAHQEMNGRYHAMVAAQKESSFLADRWKTLPDESDSVILLLENLLDSQERLVNEESAFAKAQFDYSVAVVKLKQATGTLFQVN